MGWGWSEGAGSSGPVRSFNQGDLGGSEVDMPTSQAKPFDIPKQMVWEAYRRVAANKGAPGVDEVDLGKFEADLKNNLYRVWLCRVEDYAEWSGRSRWKGGDRSRTLGIIQSASRKASSESGGR
jgi:hypothetical protein